MQDEPEALIMMDAIKGKNAPEKVFAIAEQQNSAIFARCILK